MTQLLTTCFLNYALQKAPNPTVTRGDGAREEIQQSSAIIRESKEWIAARWGPTAPAHAEASDHDSQDVQRDASTPS